MDACVLERNHTISRESVCGENMQLVLANTSGEADLVTGVHVRWQFVTVERDVLGTVIIGYTPGSIFTVFSLFDKYSLAPGTFPR